MVKEIQEAKVFTRNVELQFECNMLGVFSKPKNHDAIEISIIYLLLGSKGDKGDVGGTGRAGIAGAAGPVGPGGPPGVGLAGPPGRQGAAGK